MLNKSLNALLLTSALVMPAAAQAANTVWTPSGAGGHSQTITRPSGTMASGACMLLSVVADGGSALTVNDGHSNSYTNYSTSGSSVYFEVATGVTSGSSSITITANGTNNVYTTYGVEIPSPCSVDRASEGTASGANPSAPSVTTTNNGDLVFGQIVSQTSFTRAIDPGTGYAGLVAANSGASAAGSYTNNTGTYRYYSEMEDETQTTAGAIAPAFVAASDSWYVGTIAIAPASSSSTPQCGTTVTPVVSSGKYVLQCQLNDNLTINNPSGLSSGGGDGFQFELQQPATEPGTAYTVTLGTAYNQSGHPGTNTLSGLSTTASQVDDFFGVSMPTFTNVWSGQRVEIGAALPNMGD